MWKFSREQSVALLSAVASALALRASSSLLAAMENGPSVSLVQLDNSSTKEPARKNLEGNMCFVTEWYRERLPHEYNGGSCLTRDRGAVKDEGLDGPAIAPKKEKILIFADSTGICPNEITGAKGFMDSAPQDRIDTVKVVSTPPGELSVKEMMDVVRSNKWDILVWGYGCENVPPGCNDVNAVIKLQDDVQRLLLALVKAMQTSKDTNRLVILTNLAMSIEPKEHEYYGLGIITHANLIGAANAYRLELAEAFRIHYVDCPGIHAPEMEIDICSEVFREEGFGTNSVRLNSPHPDEPNVHMDTCEGRFTQRIVTSNLYAECAAM